MTIALIIIFICSCILCFLGFYNINHCKQIDIDTTKKNEEIKRKNKELSDLNYDLQTKNKILNSDNETLQCQHAILQANETRLSQEIERLTKIQENLFENQTEASKEAFQKYCEVLDSSYSVKEKEYNNSVSQLKKNVAEVQKDLDSLQATRAAIIQAQLREKEIKEKLDFYCIQISDSDKADIQKLENIKKTLNKPRVLSMLIWQTWFQKPLKALSASILGTTEKTGIYKITNIVTNECYIGQAVDVAKRWTDHAKCGLGIDTPAGNKLYKSMQEYGLYEFSWELLEECSREQLNEKEKYYINLYNSYELGFNGNRGNK